MKRRTFVQKSAMATASLVTAFHIPSLAQNKTLKVGLIGCGWYGMVITTAALKFGGVEVIGICDVDTKHLKNSADELEKLQGKRPASYKDYNELIDMPGLEAVFIGTPPHWHALQFIAACKKGLHIYCEKPLAYDVREGQAMMAAAKAAGNIVQIGFQRRQSKAFQKAREMVLDGSLGKVHQVGAQIHYRPGKQDNTIQDPPASLDWENWCGPATKLDYRPNIGHKAWRLEKEYGNGHLVDWGIHHIDIIRTIMDLDMPTTLEAYGGLNHLKGKITTPDTLHATLGFEKCPVHWQHRLWGTGDLNPQFNNGVFIYGEKATLFASDNRLVKMPQGKDSKHEIMDIPEPKAQENHVADFVRAVKAKDKSLISCEISDAFKSTASVQLAMISYYSNSRVNWDSNKLNILDNKAAARLLARPYRGDYKRPVI